MAILFMKDAAVKLKLAGAGSLVEYNTQVASAEVEVSPGDEVQYPTLDGNVANNIGPSSYALVLRAGQDWSTTGLAKFLWDNEGALLDFEYQAHGKAIVEGPTAAKVVGQCRAVAGNYGGEVGTFAEIEVSLPCSIKPTLDVTPIKWKPRFPERVIAMTEETAPLEEEKTNKGRDEEAHEKEQGEGLGAREPQGEGEGSELPGPAEPKE